MQEVGDGEGGAHARDEAGDPRRGHEPDPSPEATHMPTQNGQEISSPIARCGPSPRAVSSTSLGPASPW